MPKPPSPIDQCFKHWPSRWQMQPKDVAASKRTIVDIQNIRDYAADHAKRVGAPMRLGRLLCPWDRVVFTWQEATNNAGIAYKMAFVEQTRFDNRQASVLSIITMQYESGGGAQTILSGMISIALPYDGLPEDDPSGLQTMRCGILGFQGIDDDAFALCRHRVLEWTTKFDLDALAITSLAQRDWGRSSQIDMTVICAALSFLNCKNVVAQEAGRTSPPPKWVQAGLPTVKYHVIKIDGRVTKRSGESSSETGRHLSLHVCRGSFAHYTAAKPLFGKLVGDFWRPQHTRGSAEVGTVEKTYKIVPPGAT